MKKKAVKATHRAHVYYTGRVQGVGFRYTAEGFALEERLLGWVRNLPDGRVELICEGSKEKIEVLFDRIMKSALGRHIKNAHVSWETPTQEFSDFTVEFYY